MKRVGLYFASVLILVLAGVVGTVYREPIGACLRDVSLCTDRDPYHRAALRLEQKHPRLDVLYFGPAKDRDAVVVGVFINAPEGDGEFRPLAQRVLEDLYLEIAPLLRETDEYVILTLTGRVEEDFALENVQNYNWIGWICEAEGMRANPTDFNAPVRCQGTQFPFKLKNDGRFVWAGRGR